MSFLKAKGPFQQERFLFSAPHQTEGLFSKVLPTNLPLDTHSARFVQLLENWSKQDLFSISVVSKQEASRVRAETLRAHTSK